MQRYAQLLGIIRQEKPQTIIEVGTWDGGRAVEMANEALAHGKCLYVGFDLFEGATAETDAEEFNVKKHVSVQEVRDKLNNLANEFSDFSFQLHVGNTRETLKDFSLDGLPRPIMAFIDGGHSIATIKNDLENLISCDIVIIDDFYKEDDAGRKPDIERFGCNRVLDELTEGEDYYILPIGDPVKDGGIVHMVSMGRKFDIQISKKLNVQTKNSVSDEAIQRNVLYALQQDLQEVKRHYPHKGICTFVSGGESFKENIEEIRADQENGCYVACVKTSHDQLIERDLVPDACVLLDPRAHVTEFITKPHPKVQYYVASQVYWETMRHLVTNGANIRLYHAMVNAGEREMLGEGRIMILGGSTSATRGLSLMHTLGFRHFRLYGYDSSFIEKPGEEYFEKFKDKQSKRPIKVRVLDEKFWTTPELIAQSRDFEQLMDPTSPNDSFMEVFGSKKGKTLIAHMYEKLYKPFERWEAA